MRDARCVTPDAHSPMRDERRRPMHDTARHELSTPADTPSRLPVYKIDDML